MLLYELVDAFNAIKLKYALIGGYALALHGLVRATMDVDFILTLKQSDFELAEQTLQKLGLQSRLPIRAQELFKMREEYIQKRNLLAWSFVDYADPCRQVDILITKDLANLQTEKISVAGRKISVATLNEILKMKQAAGRPQDLIDVENILAKLKEKNETKQK